jgi:hypothetical protein
MVPPNTCDSRWYVPTNAGRGVGQIRLNNTNLCLQQDNAASPNVVLNTCQGLASENWIAHLIPGTAHVTYSYQNQYTHGCLNDDYYIKYLNVANCNDAADQLFQFPFL